MASKADLAKRFEQMAHMLELTGADRFRVNAHARAARAIADYAGDLGAIAGDEEALTAIEGVGAKTAAKIGEYYDTGAIAEHAKLLGEVPPGLLEVLEIPGLGPKTVRVMWRDKGVESKADLARIIEDGSILDLPRMGKKTVENIARAMAFAETAGERIRLGVAMPVAETIVERLRAVPGVTRAAYAGSLRRGRETIGDVDVLVCSDDPDAAREAFTTMEGVGQVLAKGETKSSVRLTSGRVSLQADLRIVPEASWGAALMYFTGSKEHNVRLRELAIRKGLTLNEYGLFPNDGEDSPPQSRGVEPVAGGDEAAVYDALGLAPVPPELREDRGEVAEGWAAPDLIELGDIRAELHAHTTASDGKMSIDELAAEAKRRGFHTIAVTDHSKSSAIANGLDEDRLRRHAEAVREADARTEGITILAGSEVDIHADGTLDYDDDTLAMLDVVVASPHAALNQDPGAATRRLLRAIEHPLVRVLGHPTGRLVGKREGLSPDIAELAAAAAEHDTALEINANSLRLDLRDAHVRVAIEAGAPIAIDCDVHRPEHYDELRYGVLTARRAGLTADRCVNTWPARRLRSWLAR